MITYQLWFDGGARGNPGPAAAGIVLKDRNNRTIVEHGEYLGRATNNQAEYTAFRIGLEELFACIDESDPDPSELKLDVRTDSQLLQKQVDGQWKTKDEQLSSIQDEIFELLEQLGDWEIQHVPREENEEADRIVNRTLDEQE